MKSLYLQCGMGASGDMLLGALCIPGVNVWMEPSVKCGIEGNHVSMTVHGEEEESLDHHDHEYHDHDHHHEHHHDHEHYHDHEHHHEHTHSGMHEIGHSSRGNV